MEFVKSLLEGFKKGEMDRREFFKKGAQLGLSATTLGFLLSHFDPTRNFEMAKAEAQEKKKKSGKIRVISISVALEEPHLKKFHEDTGIQVEPTPASLSGMMNKFISGGFRTYDAIDENMSYMPVLWETGSLKPIPVDAIPNAKYLAEIWVNPKAPGNWLGWPMSQVYTDNTRKYFKCVPRFMNFEAFGFNTEKLPEDTRSYGALVDPKWAGRTAVWNDYSWTMSWVATYLKYNGKISAKDVSDLDPKEVDLCMAFLTEKKKAGQFRAFWDDFGQIVNLMASGEVWISDCWNPVIEAAKKSGFKGKYVNPLEGNRPWFHGIALSKDSKNADLVYEYANWSLEGWWGAQVLPTGWIPATMKAKDYLAKDVWDFWMEGKGRDTGAFVERAKNVACWPHWPKEADYYLTKWLNFLAA